MANVVTGALTATGRSAPFQRTWNQGFNFSLWGTFTASIQLERSFDRGDTWLPVTAFGTLVQFSGPVSESWEDVEDVLYSLNCTSLSSGTVNYRFSQ